MEAKHGEAGQTKNTIDTEYKILDGNYRNKKINGYNQRNRDACDSLMTDIR